MKKLFIWFPILLFFTVVCVGSQAHKEIGAHTSSLHLQDQLFQKADHHFPIGFDVLSDSPDELTLDDLDKVKFDAGAVVEQWISYFFTVHYFSFLPVVVHHQPYNKVPKYILYHSLQISNL